MKTKTVLFDLGNVLIEWDQAALLNKLLTSKDSKHSSIRELFKEWNQEWDRGRLYDGTITKIKEFPKFAALIQAYNDRWIETLGQPILGTVEILQHLKNAGYRLYAASNWAADTFELAKPRLTFLNLFDGIQISGHVGLIKPEIEFFQRMATTYNFLPQEAIFIDDQENNVLAAQSLGITAIQFQNPAQLEQDLFNLL